MGVFAFGVQFLEWHLKNVFPQKSLTARDLSTDILLIGKFNEIIVYVVLQTSEKAGGDVGEEQNTSDRSIKEHGKRTKVVVS